MALQVWSVGIEGYRSVRRLHFPLKRLNVFIGENGVGKTNLYRGLQLVQAAAAGSLIPTCIDHDPCAHLRRPMVMMCQG